MTYHGVKPFNKRNGDFHMSVEKLSLLFWDCRKYLNTSGKDDRKIVAVTAAMCSGTGLSSFSEQYPKRFFDVGIAEQHAVTFSAGLATQGYKPFFVVYSSFLQRAYDQVIHDVAIQRLPVVFVLTGQVLLVKMEKRIKVYLIVLLAIFLIWRLWPKIRKRIRSDARICIDI